MKNIRISKFGAIFSLIHSIVILSIFYKAGFFYLKHGSSFMGEALFSIFFITFFDLPVFFLLSLLEWTPIVYNGITITLFYIIIGGIFWYGLGLIIDRGLHNTQSGGK